MILVTGGTGQIGSHLLFYLKINTQVYDISRSFDIHFDELSKILRLKRDEARTMKNKRNIRKRLFECGNVTYIGFYPLNRAELFRSIGGLLYKKLFDFF